MCFVLLTWSVKSICTLLYPFRSGKWLYSTFYLLIVLRLHLENVFIRVSLFQKLAKRFWVQTSMSTACTYEPLSKTPEALPSHY